MLATPILWAQPPASPSLAELRSHHRMLVLLQQVADEAIDASSYLGDQEARRLRAVLESPLPGMRLVERWQVLFHLAEAELRLGETRRAIALFEEAGELASEVGGEIPAEHLRQLVFRTGVAYMRLAETENCAESFVAESCILPIRAPAVHGKREAAQSAARLFATVAASTPPDDTLHYGARWLLNLAHMVLGTWPDDVAPELRIPEAAFASDEPFPRFDNVAPRLGLDTFSLSGGAVAEDFDGDGDLDLLVSTWDPRGQLRLFRNGGDGTFLEVTKEAGLVGITGGLNMVQADYDNDGDADVLVLRGAWLDVLGRHPNSLLRNDGRGRFVDVAFAAGLGERHFPTQTAAWADIDNDGDLDLYVGNETSDNLAAPSQLFLNRGDGTFEEVARRAGVTNDAYAKAVVFGDVDGDRFPDLFVSNLGEPNRLYRNRGDGTFDDVAHQLGVESPVGSFPSWLFDYDNDGDLDLYVSVYMANIGHIAASHLGMHTKVELARLYRNDLTEGGGFLDVARDVGLTRPTAPMGSNFGDLDGDGWLDFYLGTGYPDYQALMPNVLMRNREGRRFADVTWAAGTGHLQKGHAVVFADLDADGDLDLFEQMGGAFPGDGFRDVLYENPGFGSRFVSVELVGIRSNRSAIGARLRVVVRDAAGERRTIWRVVSSGGSFGANPLRQHVGLGAAAEEVELLEVEWPTSQTTQRFTEVPLDRHYRIVEGESKLRVVEIPATSLGGKDATDGGR
jgi:hypothetical protein